MVRLPSGVRYWTVLDEDLAVVPVADSFLRQVRFGRGGAESTAKAYAGGIALFLRWCARSGRGWEAGAGQLGLFMTWLAHACRVPVRLAGAAVLAGPGTPAVRSARRINAVLAAVRGMIVHAVAEGTAGGHLVQVLYEVADDRDLPAAARGEDGGAGWRMRARHRLHEPVSRVDRAGDGDVVAVLGACGSARDRLIVLLMVRAGLRRGEVLGLRRSDVHLLADSRELGCGIVRPHLHVVRREDNVNGAIWAASHFPDSFICVISCCELPVQVLVVGFLRSPVTECRVETLAIIADLDVPGNVLPCFLSRRVRGPVHPLDLHRRVK